MKSLFLITFLFFVGGSAFAEIPNNPTRDQIVASCVATKVTVAERVALQGCKTKLDAAELLQSIYQERADVLRAQSAAMSTPEYIHSCLEWVDPVARHQAVLKEWTVYTDALKEINSLIVTLKAEPAPKARKKR